MAKTLAVSVLRGISSVKREERKANEHLIATAPKMYGKLAELEAILRPIIPLLADDIAELLKEARGE